MLVTMYQWCVVAFSSDLWNIPTLVDQVLDGRVIQAHVKIDALCEQCAAVAIRSASRDEIRAHVAPAVSPRTIGNRLLAAGLRSRVPLARLSLTPQHHQARLLWSRKRVDWRVEWRSVIFSDESRFSLYSSDRRTCVRCRSSERSERHLLKCICRRHTGSTSGFMVWRTINYNSQSHLVFLQGKVNRLLILCQCHFFDRKVMWFFSRTTYVHIRLLCCNVLFMVYNNCPGQQDPQISCQLNTYGKQWSRNLLFLQSLLYCDTCVHLVWIYHMCVNCGHCFLVFAVLNKGFFSFNAMK